METDGHRGPVHAVGIDVGGTSVCAVLVNEYGESVARNEWRIDSNGSRAHILGVVCSAAQYATAAASDHNVAVVGVGIGVPGPFDYDAGIHQATHKFRNIVGVPLRNVIRISANVGETVPIRFLHDIHAFLLGEYWIGSARGRNRVMAINIGTGLGVGYARGGTVLHNGSGGPWRSIYAMPCGDGILEDFVSRRGVIREYRSQRKSRGMKRSAHVIDVEEIAARARAGDAAARATFERTGVVLAKTVSPVSEEFQPDCIVFGGRISLAFDLFEQAFRNEFPSGRKIPEVFRSDDPPTSALLGAAYSVLPEVLQASDEHRQSPTSDGPSDSSRTRNSLGDRP